MAKVFLKERKARPFWFGHPWVFSGAIDRTRGQLKGGSIVTLCDHEGREIGEGFWNPRSQIRVRLVALAHEGALGEELLVSRLRAAIALRERQLGLGEVADSWRVVHSEADGLPGLIVDKVADWLVIQVSSLGLAAFVPALVDALVAHFQPKGVLERVSRVGVEEEGLEREDGVLFGTPPEGPIPVREHGQTYWCDPGAGQKTGWYADQRENRRAVARLAKGARVLDAFSYTGGFGLPALAAGAQHVTFVDSSGPALALAERGLPDGMAERAHFEEGNVLRVLDHMARAGDSFDLVVLDPPKLVHKMGALRKGLRLYHEIFEKGVRVTADGGVLCVFSCSGHVGDHELDEVLGSVAKAEAVRLQVFERFEQGPDHPVMLPLQESRYLNGRAMRVLRGI